MFALSALVQAGANRVVPMANGQPDLRALPDEYRFPVQGIPAVRIPKQRQVIGDKLREVAEDVGPLLWATLAKPVHRIPLVAARGDRMLALVSGALDDDNVLLSEARLTIKPGSRRHAPAELARLDFNVVRSLDTSIDRLVQLWLDAEVAARAAAFGPVALWLGGNPARQMDSGDLQIQALCAAFGLRAEVMADATRHVRQLRARLGANMPAYLITWRPYCSGLESVLDKFREAGDGEVVELSELDFEESLFELRLALLERGLDGKPPADVVDEGKAPPDSGEERFYIKHHGSKVGDRMIEVADCEHGQWGSDRRSKAPRAFKGIVNGVGVEPLAIFKCAKCTKNRWRARF